MTRQPNISATDIGSWIWRLSDLGNTVVRNIQRSQQRDQESLRKAIGFAGGDTIFAIDREVEPLILVQINSWLRSGDLDKLFPLILICEGLGENGIMCFGPKESKPKWRLIIDPIDGTRNIMYDKRSAWFIAAVAPNLGPETSVADAVVSMMLEIPPSRQTARSIFITQSNARGIRTLQKDINSETVSKIKAVPSTATSLQYGFAQVANFFPGTKVLASELMERIVSKTLGDQEEGSALVFEDQYISTAGQMVELILGHDRFCCDLRPLFYQILEKETNQKVRGLECHPYDVAGITIAQKAGVIITDGLGNELCPPMDVHTPVHWCGYANKSLRRQIEPVILEWLREKGIF
ncbi:inositol monophosphatase [Patescibacteria group bacterium]|nr:inositol monophosphatase [Patescibacteria group bacterium]MBU1075104.1 inositol monophosphatase [Patescibacteria group bacterium]MBU1952142.1 inositol monophosphatase [Patescibacteria group bacterium]MBU2236007.1 inositol monophosphatase [Patescibacteria group bacterium]